MQTQQIAYTLQGEENGRELKRIRLTVKTCNMLDMAQYNKAVREINAWFAETHDGLEIGQMDDERFRQLEDDGELEMFYIGRSRAKMLAALQACEMMNGTGDWQPAELPWQTVEQFATEIPGTLFRLWEMAVERCNPGLFTAALTEDEKKSGAYSVNWLTK